MIDIKVTYRSSLSISSIREVVQESLNEPPQIVDTLMHLWLHSALMI